jgi:hypothetical protein
MGHANGVLGHKRERDRRRGLHGDSNMGAGEVWGTYPRLINVWREERGCTMVFVKNLVQDMAPVLLPLQMNRKRVIL